MLSFLNQKIRLVVYFLYGIRSQIEEELQKKLKNYYLTFDLTNLVHKKLLQSCLRNQASQNCTFLILLPRPPLHPRLKKKQEKNCHSSTFLQLSYICNADVFANKDSLSDLENQHFGWFSIKLLQLQFDSVNTCFALSYDSADFSQQQRKECKY